MRKSTKKFLSVAMLLALTFSLTACGDKDNSKNTITETTPTTEAGGNTTEPTGDVTTEVEKPKSITVMVNGTIFTEANGRDAFEAALEEKLGIDIIFNQPEHTGYYDVVGNTFASGDWPDVVILGAEYYASYAALGALADVTDFWNNSELKASGRVNEEVMESVAIDGRLYGFTPARGNGCLTYIRKSWLDKVNMEVPTNYEEYKAMLQAFAENDMDGSGDPSNTYGVTAAGLIGSEAPYTNYLPEFYQDAYPDFYQKEDGTWVDGFSEDAMSAALGRLKEAYESGWIDKETLTNGTKDCRNKFYDDKVGVFTYWAGTWAANLKQNLEANGHNSELVLLPPIAELGKYVERQTGVWAITSKAENPAGIYKYFLETMLDGGEVQKLWTYGAEGTHWSTKAETFTAGEKTYTYKEGEFHMLPSPEKPDTILTKGHIDTMLSVAPFIGEDPGVATIFDEAKESAEKFNSWSTIAPVIVSNDLLSEYNADLWDARIHVITQVVTQGMSVEDGMKYYQDKTNSMIEEILASLNK